MLLYGLRKTENARNRPRAYLKLPNPRLDSLLGYLRDERDHCQRANHLALSIAHRHGNTADISDGLSPAYCVPGCSDLPDLVRQLGR